MIVHFNRLKPYRVRPVQLQPTSDDVEEPIGQRFGLDAGSDSREPAESAGVELSEAHVMDPVPTGNAEPTDLDLNQHSESGEGVGEGGDLTLFMTGKRPRPSTEPMYSKGNIDDFPITNGYDSVEYTDFINSHIRNSQNILISQSMCYGTFGGCFAPSKRYSPRPSLTWGIRKNYDDFLEFVNEQSQNIYSLACDENLGFGVFFMKNYGTGQAIIRNTSDIKKKWDEGFKITACAARGSTFYVIMTKDAEEYKDKAEKWFTCSTWAAAKIEILKDYKEGKVITGLCYSSVLGLYFVVMAKTPEVQCYHRSGDIIARVKWMDEKNKKGFHPTIIFKYPTDQKILVVMTKDQNRSGLGYHCTYNQKIVN
ncbi:hypothetical protein OS493_038348 [Desmophyllum pertusum]|uniref:Uncharacterized protein n=1 Tax=Desmophyllum pertusum TaxID=174260 RepID=A0A9X0CMS5_9CNID|nr:hypothetical protein OS493_038348 [Desmophyllum pertusum]